MIEALQALCNKFVPLGIEEARISTKFNTLTGEFSIPEMEAVRMISTGLEKELGIINEEGNRTEGYKANFTRISALSSNMLDADVRGQLLSIEIPKSQKLQYAGVIGDETGAIRFVISKGLNKVGTDIPAELIPGKSYEFHGAQVSEYSGSLSLFLNGYSAIFESEETIDTPLFNPVLIQDITPGVVDLHAAIIRLSGSTHEKIRYSGTLADSTGTARFVIWKNDNNESLNLQQGQTYEISLASASIRNGQLNIDLTGAVINPSVEVIESPADDRATITGDITRLKTSTGRGTEVVYRCPECNRIVEIAKGGYECKTHGIVNPVKEFRIKARIDNGCEAWSAIINLPALLEMLGWTKEQLFDYRDNDPLGDGAIDYLVYDKFFGRRVILRGYLIDGRMIADGCSLAYPEAVLKVSEQLEVV